LPDSELEKEALHRATSVYLVDRVVPMLPEKISNELCSLRPHEDKLTFSAVFEIDNEANIYQEWFGRTIIHSDRRFSYEEAQERLETGKGDFAEELIILNNIAKKFTQQRFKLGAINFETTEVRFKLDEEFKPIGIYLKERKDAHRLIEEFMLLANKKVAEFVHNFKHKEGETNPMVYRVHESPIEDKVQNFANFAKQFGFQIKTQGKALAHSLNDLIAKIHNTPQQNTLESLAIRTMAKARYSTEEIGHYGLAFKHYTHFTSPIRRYPDMMVHRLLALYLSGKKESNVKELEKRCKHSTEMEKRAADAERASIKYKQVEYMSILTKNQNKIFEGVVTGVTEWGVFVEITETKCEGMVRLGDMYDDVYQLEPEKYRLVGTRTKKIITFGDVVKVRVKDTNLEKRTMDLLMVK
jgi:ribonuclease R